MVGTRERREGMTRDEFEDKLCDLVFEYMTGDNFQYWKPYLNFDCLARDASKSVSTFSIHMEVEDISTEV